MQNYTNTNLLNLKGVSIDEVVSFDDHIDVKLHSLYKEGLCPVCGYKTSRIHDYRLQRIQHTPIGLRKVFLFLRKKRFVCPHCQKRFYESLDFLAPYSRRTKDLHFFIQDQLKQVRSLSSIAKDLGLSSSCLTSYLKLAPKKCPNLPRVLSMDEFKGNAGGDKYQCILVDPIHHQVLDILPSRRKKALMDYFSSFPKEERRRVKYVVMDMSHLFYAVLKEFFPQATFIADKFHFARQVFWALENVRKTRQKTRDAKYRLYFKRSKSILRKKGSRLSPEEKEKLELMLWQDKEIKEAYLLKERFYDVLDASSKEEARQALDKWLWVAKESGLKEFKASIRAYENWKEEILNAFSTGITNGQTEGFNNKIKVIKRVSYGYRNFENFKSRILMVFRA